MIERCMNCGSAESLVSLHKKQELIMVDFMKKASRAIQRCELLSLYDVHQCNDELKEAQENYDNNVKWCIECDQWNDCNKQGD